jgi:hypothetical protein
MDFLNHKEGFSIRFLPPFSFTVYSNETVEIHKRLREFEEIEISRKSCRGDWEQQVGKL